MRRHRNPRRTDIYQSAIYSIGKMERAVVRLMAPTEGLTPADVLDWIIPPDELKLLRATLPYAQVGDGSYSAEFRTPYGKVDGMLRYVAMGCVPPKSKLVAVQPEAPKHEQLMSMVEAIADIAKQFDKLRSIVRHFNTGITPGAAKHYFPAMQSLLDAGHPFHKVDGERHKAVPFTYEMAEMLREAPEIVAKGLLCDPNANGGSSTSCMTMRVGDGDQYFAIFPEKK